MPRCFQAMLLVLLLALGGCAIRANSDYTEGTDFSALRTFAPAPPPKEIPEALPGYSAITAQHIQNLIGSKLEAKGFRRATAQRADMLVAFSVGGEARTDLVGTGGGYYGWGGSTYTQHYVVGRIVIDILDGRSQKLIWHGWATKEIFESASDDKAIEEVVEAILKKFPPRAS